MPHSFTATALKQAHNVSIMISCVYAITIITECFLQLFLFLPTFEENRSKRDESVEMLVGLTVSNRTQLTFTCWNSGTFLQMLADNFFPCC